MKKAIFLLLSSFIALPFAADASVLYFDKVAAEHGPGDSFGVNIRLDLEGKCVNAIEGTVEFPKDLLRFADFSSGQSMMSLWIDQPSSENSDSINSEGKIYFAGGMPGGYCGKIPGDPGDSNIVGRIIFSVPSLTVGEGRKTAKISFLPETSVYLNDGRATKDKLALRDAELVLSEKQTLVKDEWKSELSADNLKPEPFVIELSKNTAVAEGQYFIYFSTTDKQSGIDHYEVLEMKTGEVIGEKPKKNFWELITNKETIAPIWKQAQSPFVLSDQSLESIIKVKAVDKAGNERIVEYIPPVDIKNAVIRKNYLLNYGLPGLAVICLVFIGYAAERLIRRRRK